MPEQTIPVVDLRDFTEGDANAQKRFVKTLGDAFVEYGFAAVDNHGVDRGAVEGSYAEIKSFFKLPDAVKKNYEIPGGGGQRGYTSFGTEHAKGRTIADLKEFWHVGPELPTDHALHGRMPGNVWPSELPGFYDQAMAFYNSLEACGAQLLRALARYLGADENGFAEMIEGGNSVLRMIRYPGPDEVAPEPDQVWAAAHEDINLITLLVEATQPGLQLLKRDGEWMGIEPIEGQLIADAGDMLQLMTNGRIPSTTHRVMAPPNQASERFSMPFFIHPHPDHMLTTLESCVSEDNPRKWDDISAEAYLNQRLREIGLLKD